MEISCADLEDPLLWEGVSVLVAAYEESIAVKAEDASVESELAAANATPPSSLLLTATTANLQPTCFLHQQRKFETLELKPIYNRLVSFLVCGVQGRL
jgi:hypothetical protein